MRLTLCLPGLLLPAQALRDTASDLPLPALALLLGRGRVVPTPAGTSHGWLAASLDLPALPAAALRVLGSGGVPGDADWLCLDPVHLKVHRRGLTLGDPTDLDLSDAEDAALRAALAPVFADFGELIGGAPGHWHIQLTAPCALDTLPLPQAAGYDVDPAYPGGASGTAWRRQLSEAQTVLHAHAVNRERAAAGRPVINALWPWGQGALPAPCRLDYDLVATRDAVVVGLAQRCNVAVRTPPKRYEDAAGSRLVLLDDLARPARQLEAMAWRDALSRLEQDWFSPLVDALRARRCKALTLVGFGAGKGFELQVSATDLWKIWRGPQPLADLAHFAEPTAPGEPAELHGPAR